jgi:hypothetical protein
VSTSQIERRPLTPLDVQQTRDAITQYQAGLKSLLDPAEDVQSFVDRKGEKHSFVKRSGWRKIALWCDLNIENRTTEIDRDANGKPLRARVIARAVAPSGRFADGEGGCDLTERSVSKPEHDLLAIAATRAVNRAVSNLVGLGAVSAEEMDGTGEPMTPESGPPYGPDATPEMRGEAMVSLVELWPNLSASDADAMLNLLAANFGSLPEITVRTIKGLQWCVNNPPAKPEPTGPEFEEIVTPAEPEKISTPTVEKTEDISTPTVEKTVATDDDEVDIDAMFDAESQFLE